MRAVVKRLEGDGGRTEAVGAELTVLPERGGLQLVGRLSWMSPP